MKSFNFQSDEAIKFAIEFNAKPVNERFAMFREYLEELRDYPYKAIDGAKWLAKNEDLESYTLPMMISVLGKKGSLIALSHLGAELLRYEKKTGVVLEDLIKEVEKAATLVRNTKIDPLSSITEP